MRFMRCLTGGRVRVPARPPQAPEILVLGDLGAGTFILIIYYKKTVAFPENVNPLSRKINTNMERVLKISTFSRPFKT